MHATLFGRRRQILSLRAVHLGRRWRGRTIYKLLYDVYTSVSEDQWKNDNSHNTHIGRYTIQVCIQCVPVVGTHRIIYTLYIILYYIHIWCALRGHRYFYGFLHPHIVCLLSCTLHKTAAACLILLSCDYRCGIPVTWFSARMSPITIYLNSIYNLCQYNRDPGRPLGPIKIYNELFLFHFMYII